MNTFLCGPSAVAAQATRAEVGVVLFQAPDAGSAATAGSALRQTIGRRGYSPDALAWDFLALALSVLVADMSVLRSSSPDGWTREFRLRIAVSDPALWNSHSSELAAALQFLTTDRWIVEFISGAERIRPGRTRRRPSHDAVALLSGGLDSLVGTIDLSEQGVSLFPISQTVRGDAEKQSEFAREVGQSHLALNPIVQPRDSSREGSQRARSLGFLALAVLAATSLQRYRTHETVPLYVCENGFIAINPPLTHARLGSLSTRTAHPEFLTRLQRVFDQVGLRVQVSNPYAERTKGEMLVDCMNQDLLQAKAARSTSCGRFQRFGYTHCGRCVPCQVRRAAFLRWGVPDSTQYVYDALGRLDSDHAAFDDVRSVAMAVASVRDEGLDRWLGPSLSSPFIQNRVALREMVGRGLAELELLHHHFGVS